MWQDVDVVNAAHGQVDNTKPSRMTTPDGVTQ
jgi:hypothetical protein